MIKNCIHRKSNNKNRTTNHFTLSEHQFKILNDFFCDDKIEQFQRLDFFTELFQTSLKRQLKK